MRKISLCLLVLFAVCVRAQVTTNPNPIEDGYTGKIIITFDPNKGNGGMKDATQCYVHTGYCTEKADWQGVIGTWRGSNQPQLTKVGDKWQLEIDNMYKFYNIPGGTKVTALVFVFHDGKINGKDGTKEGKTSSGGGKNRSIALLLAIVPGIFGVLGLGILYNNKSSRPGILLLAIGLLTFILFLVIVTSSIPILNIILAIPVAIFYGLLYIGNLVGTLMSPSSS